MHQRVHVLSARREHSTKTRLESAARIHTVDASRVVQAPLSLYQALPVGRFVKSVLLALTRQRMLGIERALVCLGTIEKEGLRSARVVLVSAVFAAWLMCVY
jgi:hypothetical protein